MSNRDNFSQRICCFCNLAEDNELEYGKLHEYNGIVTHYYCLLLSSNMEQKGNDDEGILGFLTEDIQKELRRGKRLVCSYCKKIGATLGCCNVKCKKIFHFPCGLKASSLHQYFGEFRSYCINHRPKQQIDKHILKQINPSDKILCYICYDKVNPTDFVKTLWAPCCKKNAFFHRKCVQQLASSAGYFFKCPLCNNKQDFRDAMLEYGIFIPSQDASWELVPNAFEELLYRHDQCDAVKCLCPKGRKHVSSNAKWELTLCRICGSQGIHMACGQLKWGNPLWECTECTSILHSSKIGEDMEADNSSDCSSRDSNSDLNSDTNTDISVGTEFPVLCTSSNFNSNLSTISLPNFTSDIRLRPGPRCFKLQQRMIKCSLELTHDANEKDVTIELDQDTNVSPKNKDNEKSNDDLMTIKENNTRKERQVSNNNVTSQSIQTEADVITIESDDDNEVEIITLKQKTNPLNLLQLTSRSNISHISSSSKDIYNSKLNTVKNSTSKISDAILSNVLEKDNTTILYESTISKPNISNKSKSIISKQFDIATSQKSMQDLIISNSNDVNSMDTEDIIETPIMNIKITNITSLPPEVFESVPDVTLHENSTNTSSPSTSKSLEEFVTYIAPPKRVYEEANNVVNNCKKIKRDHFDKESLVLRHDIDTSSANKQRDGKISPIKVNEIQDPLKYIIMKELSNSYNNQKDDLSTKFMSFHETDDTRCTSQVAENYSKENVASLNVQQNSEDSVKILKTYLPSSKCKNQVCLPTSLENVHPTSLIKSNLITNQENNVNVLYEPPNFVSTNDIAASNYSQTIINQPMTLDTSVLLHNHYVANGNQTQDKNLDKKKTTLMKEKMFTDPVYVASPDDKSSNSIFCDGDAGTCPAEIDSIGRKKRALSSGSYGRESMDNSKAVESYNPVATRSVFPKVTNNHSTCHQPRLIPQYMNLHDLKFRVCKSNNVQMVLYDTFSVNIPMKNSKESKIQLANAAAQREPKELSYHAPNEASSSVKYIDDSQTAKQRFIKFFHSLKNENSVNDKIKYVRDQDDTKENLDPVKSKILSFNGTFDNNFVNDTGDTMVAHNSFHGDNDNEMRLVSGDTNLSALNRTLYNKNIEDSVIDDTVFISNDRNQVLQVNWENVQQHKQISINDMMPASTEEKIARSFYKETNRIVDSDFNILKTNKNVEKTLQDDITVSTNRHKDSNRKITNDHIDDSQTMLQNSYKYLDSTNVMKLKVPNRNSTHVSNIIFNKYNILNKQIDMSDSLNCTRFLAFDQNIVNHNSENNFRHNSESCLKVSIDLCKIQSLIDAKPKFFVNQKCNFDDKQHK